MVPVRATGSGVKSIVIQSGSLEWQLNSLFEMGGRLRTLGEMSNEPH